MKRSLVVEALRSDRWRAFVLPLSLAVVCGSIWVFAEVTDEVSEGELQEHEEQFMRSLRRHDDPGLPIGPNWAEEVGRDLTALGGVALTTLVTLLVVGYLLLAKKRRAAVLVVVAVAGGIALSLIMKAAFDRPRPEVVPHLTRVTTSSFPSGHSMLSSVVYLTLGTMLARAVAARRLQIYFVAAALLLSLLVGVSRVYMGVHYPSDVLAGWAAGTAWASLVWLVAFWLQGRGVVEGPPEDEAEIGAP